MDVVIKRINYNSHLYSDVWNLREEVLRKPLGLSLKNEDLSRDKINEIFIALINNNVVGCVFLQPASNTDIQLRVMAVYPELQGKGIGKMLVTEAENYANKKGYEKIFLHARKVIIGFYLSMNYTVTSDEYIEVGIPHYSMEKNIKHFKPNGS